MLDFTSTKAIEGIIVDTRAADRQVFLVGVSPSITDMRHKQHMLRHFEADQLYQQRIDALRHASQLLKISIDDDAQAVTGTIAENPKNSYNSHLLQAEPSSDTEQ